MGEDASPAVNLGILGCANIARKVSRAILLAGPGVKLYAIASRSLAKAEEFAKVNGFPSSAKVYGSYEELLDDNSVDAIYVPLPTGLHREWVLKIAAKGKHILLEKPLSLTTEELDVMLEACESKGLQLMDGTMWMHHPRTQRMHKDLETLGKIKEVRSTFTFPAQVLFPSFLKENIRVKAGLDELGALGDVGWYCIRGILWSLDFRLPDLVAALPTATTNASGVITACSARLVWNNKEDDDENDNGKATVATFSCSFHAFMTMNLTVQGTIGSLVCDDFTIPFSDSSASYWMLSGAKFEDMDLAWSLQRREVAVENEIPQEAAMVREFAALVAGIKQRGDAPDRKWYEMARKTQRVLCAVRDSIAAGYAAIPLQ